ncbi:MAG: phage holin family protein [Acidobacteria bacterium]|nr:phage holin family protein [Acidobacteriota bacterium]
MGETSALIRHEVALAQVEMTDKAAKAGRNVGFLLVGGAVGYAALLLLLTAIVALISYLLPVWASALIVAIVIGIGSYVLISSALAKLRSMELAPRETVRSVKEDAKWLKDQVI